MKQLIAFSILLCLSSCATTTSHQFASPNAQWKTRTGQLAYRGPKVSLIGDVVLRTSAAGEMELTFSKAPALTLISIKQDAQFASATGPLARGSWAGQTANAPERLRGWFALREKILSGGSSVQVTNGAESFNLRF